VARASRGFYNTTEIARGLSEPLRAKYFTQSREGWQIRDEIRAMASFKHQNLMGDFSALGKFDIIFCRNVAIYFSEPDKVSLFRRIERALEVNGSLVIGAMESLNGVSPQFEPKRHLRSVYYQAKGTP
jgi:chemotaxis protein methyltransferase CheR